ncbi:hypothetical protein OJF2_70700 [Aquisphaera giovannonii]|uniref:DUF1264 domain-containing protein n=1 Tax=Aquisphaera giovannonii TaxID=406548 RepID=A0A5B9WD76_9BACT|nr:OBAP family protein [Aquisphaera giovannonii]QEH38467.1 hypothetical protein OJF2_70700 [Aquisphaera giovannonii]
MRRPPAHHALIAAAILAGCGGRNTAPTVDTPGREASPESKALEAGAMVMQDRTPVDQVHMYVCGFHFYNGDMTRQVEAHHYCIQSGEDFHQCLIFSGNGKDAKLIGLEYIIGARLFEGLPEDERRYWHSHDYEVKSGELIAPGLPEAAEHALMEKFVATYGKTIHTWQVDRGDALPLGAPQLMMGFTADGQIIPEKLAGRDGRFGVSTAAKRRSRSDIPGPRLAPGVNAWERGQVPQLEWKAGSETKGYRAAGPEATREGGAR